MVTLYVTHDNGMLGKSGEALAYRMERGGKAEIVPVFTVDGVVILGRGSVSTSALHLLMDENIPVHFIDGSGRYKGSLTSGRGRGYAIRRRQFDAAESCDATIRFIRAIIAGKLHNQRATLLRVLYRRNRGSDAISRVCDTLAELERRIERVDDIEKLRGLEGIAAAGYFSVFGTALLPPWKFTDRNRRPPKDPVNAVLSFGYTLLLSRVVTATAVVGLDPCVGYLHPEYRGRPAMALDLMEEFRSPVVDRMAISVLNQRLVEPADFAPTEDGGIAMSGEARRIILQAFSKRLRDTVHNERTGERMTYANHIARQAQFFVQSLANEAPYCPLRV